MIVAAAAHTGRIFAYMMMMAVSARMSNSRDDVAKTLPVPASAGAHECAIRDVVCSPLSKTIDSILAETARAGIVVVQDVRTGVVLGAGVRSAAPGSAPLGLGTRLMPLSVIKLFTVALWWEYGGPPDTAFSCQRSYAATQTPADIIVNGCDRSGVELGVALRRRMGAARVLQDLRRLAFRSDRRFIGGATSDTQRANQLRLAAPELALPAASSDSLWGWTLSIGESGTGLTPVDIGRFVQAVGNDGVMMPTSLTDARAVSCAGAERLMSVRTARQLQMALRKSVVSGTAKRAAEPLAGTKWTIGGKTGSGPGPGPIGPESDGWFAGLIVDPVTQPLYTIAVYIRGGGPGGGTAASVAGAVGLHLARITRTEGRSRKSGCPTR